MDFTLDTEQKALVAAVRDLASTLTPVDDGQGAPTGPQQCDRNGWSRLAEMGLLGLPFAEDSGGFGASAVEVSLAAAELGAARVALPYADALAATAALVQAGQNIDDIVSGERLVLPAFGEAGRTWAPEHPTRIATKTASGVAISGSALANVDLAGVDGLVTTATADGQLGVYFVENPTVSGASVTFEDAPAVYLGGPDVLQHALGLGVVALCGEALGAMGAALSMTTEYLKTRKQFGVPIMAFQALTHRAADLYVAIELVRSVVLFVAMTQAEGDDPATLSRAKYLVGRYGRQVGQEAIQLHGGIGMTAEYAVGHYTARLAAIERSFGDTRYHLSRLSADVQSYDSVDVV